MVNRGEEKVRVHMNVVPRKHMCVPSATVHNIHMKVKCDHRSKFSNLSNWKEEA